MLSTWVLAVLVEPVLVSLLVDGVVDLEWKVLAEIVGVAPTVEDDGYESPIERCWSVHCRSIQEVLFRA